MKRELPIPEVLYKEITVTDILRLVERLRAIIDELLQVLNKEIVIPEVLKKDINDLPIGDFWKKEIHLRRHVNESFDDDVEMTTCIICGRETPATVSNCLYCDSPLEEGYKPLKAPVIKMTEIINEGPVSPIDSWDV